MSNEITNDDLNLASEIAAKVERFIYEIIIPYERDLKCNSFNFPTEEIIVELRKKAKAAGVLTPQILSDGSHLSQRGTALVLTKIGLSPLGPLICQTTASDEINIYLLAKVGSNFIKKKFLKPLIEESLYSILLITEPSQENDAVLNLSMMKTCCWKEGCEWVIRGCVKFVAGVDIAKVGIVIAKSEQGSCIFVVDLPNPAIQIEQASINIDTLRPDENKTLWINDLRVPEKQILGEPGEGFKYTQFYLSSGYLLHWMRLYGACLRAHEIATEYINKCVEFGNLLVDNEKFSLMIAENLVDLKQVELMIDWCASVIDHGESGIFECSIIKELVSETLMQLADRCVQIVGNGGLTGQPILEQIVREVRAFHFNCCPNEIYQWSVEKNKHDLLKQNKS